MKQAKSHTRKKFKHKPYEKLGFTKQQVNQAAEITTQYLKAWTDRELRYLAINKNIPVCLPIGDHGFLIGRYKLEKLHDNCWRVSDINNCVINDFTSKISAASYAFAEHLNHLNLARSLLKADSVVSKLEIDQYYYQNTIKISLKKQDYFRADLAKLRYLDCNLQLQSARRELEKTINTAKYLKVQERLL
jgi:hypothetical protein